MKPCSFPGCLKQAVAKGLCNSHWAQNKRQGKLTPIVTHETEDARWERQVVKSADPNECWTFTGNGSGSGKSAKTGVGYGQFWYGGQKQMAHRYSYQKYVEPIPAGMQLDHTCRNPACVNPAHLEIVTAHENMRRLRSHSNLEARIKILEDFIKNLGYDPTTLKG